MKHSRFADAKWLRSDELSISIGVENNLPMNDAADIVYARLQPGESLKRHRHDRAHDGYEAFFFFGGAQIRILLADNVEHEIIDGGPFHLTFHGEEVHGITNVSTEPLVFEVLCAPKHVAGEETVVD